jgi:hypothetical protein
LKKYPVAKFIVKNNPSDIIGCSKINKSEKTIIVLSNINRIKREKKTVDAMIKLYCRNFHGQKKELCGECSELLSYSFRRLEKCPYGKSKPACVNCSTHCYNLEKRTKIREVMKFAGPRMLLYHPILAIFHIVDGKKNQHS